MYAILSDRGHQYKVTEGELVPVEVLDAQKGAAISFDKVLLVGQEGGQVKIGTPTLAGAKVTATVEEQVKAPKTISHHRVRTNSLGRRRGHRSKYTLVKIEKIQA